MEEYISHEDYKKMLKGFGKQTPKRKLTEGLEQEGNAFTAGLAKTKHGGSFKVGNKAVKDTSNYDAELEEYQFDQMYPDDPGPFEGSDKYGSFSDEHGWFDQNDKPHSDFDFDYDEEEFNDLPSLHAKHGDAKWFAKGSDGETFFDRYKEKHGGPFKVRTRKESDMEEGINSAPMQATGPTIQTVEGQSSRFSHLTSEEMDQLKQYAESIKTIKEQIMKMVNKKPEMEEGGNMTGLVMKPTTTSEGEDEEEM